MILSFCICADAAPDANAKGLLMTALEIKFAFDVVPNSLLETVLANFVSAPNLPAIPPSIPDIAAEARADFSS